LAAVALVELQKWNKNIMRLLVLRQPALSVNGVLYNMMMSAFSSKCDSAARPVGLNARRMLWQSEVILRTRNRRQRRQQQQQERRLVCQQYHSGVRFACGIRRP
jgi:hypothetical protein